MVARFSEGRLAQRAEWSGLVGPASGVLKILLKLPPNTEVELVGFSSQLERPPAYKPQAKAHRGDKPQPLPAVELHVESRTSEDRIFYKNLLESVDIEWDRISAGKGAAEDLLPAPTRSRSALRGGGG